MEFPSNHSPDDESRVPRHERLDPGEIDLTGAIPQEDALKSCIGDAITEAEAHGQLPKWGAQAIARALANRMPDPISGGLHHFAVTGRIDRELIMHQLAEVVFNIAEEETREWAERLAAYVMSPPDEPSSTQPDAGSQREPAPAAEAVLPDIAQLARGVRDHGDAFRAFLLLPDVDPTRRDLLEAFGELYRGAFATMWDLIEATTNVPSFMAAIEHVAAEWNHEESVTFDQAKIASYARGVLNIIEFGGKFYAFDK